MWRRELDGLALEVEHRNPGPEGGPTLRIRDAAGRERLRFDAFARGAHWHLDPSGPDRIQSIPGPDDPIDWVLGELAAGRHFAEAGLPLPTLAPGLLGEVDAALYNPPLDLDALDEATLRRRTGEKWRLYEEDVLPVWVADMDFPVAGPIQRLLHRAAADSDVGYPLYPLPTGLPELFAERMGERFDWQVDPARVLLLTDVVQGMFAALEVFADEGEGAVVQTPIYPPFLSAVSRTRRRLVENPLVLDGDRFVMDLDALSRAIDPGTRVLLLCNPHNPTGRAFSRDELEALAHVVLEHDLVVVADEIHQDLVYAPARHVPFASLGPEVEARTLTLTSATKAFNIAGLRCAVAAFGSEGLRQRFRRIPRHLLGGLGSLGIAATLAAWRHGAPWQEAVLGRLRENRDLLTRFVRERLPGVRVHPPEATYLAWLDCRELGLGRDPAKHFLERGRVALSNGPSFGTPGEGFARLNFATSRALLTEALERVEKSLA